MQQELQTTQKPGKDGDVPWFKVFGMILYRPKSRDLARNVIFSSVMLMLLDWLGMTSNFELGDYIQIFIAIVISGIVIDCGVTVFHYGLKAMAFNIGVIVLVISLFEFLLGFL